MYDELRWICLQVCRERPCVRTHTISNCLFLKNCPVRQLIHVYLIFSVFTAICYFYIFYLNLLRFLRFEPNFMTFCIDFFRTNCFLIIFLFLFFTNFLIFCWVFIRTSLFLKYFYHIFLYLVSKIILYNA